MDVVKKITLLSIIGLVLFVGIITILISNNINKTNTAYNSKAAELKGKLKSPNTNNNNIYGYVQYIPWPTQPIQNGQVYCPGEDYTNFPFRATDPPYTIKIARFEERTLTPVPPVFSRTITRLHPGDNKRGYFEFNNIADGTYDVCIDQAYQSSIGFFCTQQSNSIGPEPTHNPFAYPCSQIKVQGGSTVEAGPFNVTAWSWAGSLTYPTTTPGIGRYSERLYTWQVTPIPSPAPAAQCNANTTQPYHSYPIDNMAVRIIGPGYDNWMDTYNGYVQFDNIPRTGPMYACNIDPWFIAGPQYQDNSRRKYCNYYSYTTGLTPTPVYVNSAEECILIPTPLPNVTGTKPITFFYNHVPITPTPTGNWYPPTIPQPTNGTQITLTPPPTGGVSCNGNNHTFTDVATGSTYEHAISCISCRGLVSGYSSSPPCDTLQGGAPCFLPGNNVTRGQLSKFVANAAGWQDSIPTSTQSFRDVPYSSPFYLFIEKAIAHGVISGYSSSPPCDTTQGAPCFLPNNSVTRGQAMKIITNAAQFTDQILATQQTYADVPYGSPFWVFIERAKLHGLMNPVDEFACGGAGEPCPGTYFRPNSNMTRGQTSYAIATAFYPNCYIPPGP